MTRVIALLGAAAVSVVALASCAAGSSDTEVAAAAPRAIDRATGVVAGVAEGGVVVFGGRRTQDASEDLTDAVVVSPETNEVTERIPTAPFAGTAVATDAVVVGGRLFALAVRCAGRGFDPATRQHQCTRVDVATASWDFERRSWSPVRNDLPIILEPRSDGFFMPEVLFVRGATVEPVIQFYDTRDGSMKVARLSAGDFVSIPSPPLPGEICGTDTGLYLLVLRTPPVAGGMVQGFPPASRVEMWRLDREAESWAPVSTPEMRLRSGAEDPHLGCTKDGAFLARSLDEGQGGIEVLEVDTPEALISRFPGARGLVFNVASAPNGIAAVTNIGDAVVLQRGASQAEAVRDQPRGRPQLAEIGGRLAVIGIAQTSESESALVVSPAS